MARLPIPGSDNGTWGEVLNEYLSQALKPTGLLKDNAVTANTLAPNSVTNVAIAADAVNATSIQDGSITEAQLDNGVQTKLNSGGGTPDWNTITNKPAVIAAGADQAAARTAIGAGSSNLVIGTSGTTAKAGDYQPAAANISDSTATGRSLLTAADASAAKTALELTKSDVSLGNVDNTSDATKNSATVTLTNKTLTDPKINLIKDADNNTVLDMVATANADTWIGVKNTNWEQAVLFAASDQSNAGLVLETKGSGYVSLYSSAPTILADGPNTDQDLDLITKGAGIVKANGVEVTTASGIQTLTDKTISGLSNTLTDIPASAISGLTDYSKLVCVTAPGATGSEDGGDTWAKIATFSTGTAQYSEAQLILSVANRNSGAHDTAIVSVYFRTNATGQDPVVDVKVLAKGGSGVGIRSDSFKVISGGWSTDMELWLKKGGTYGRFNIYETSKSLENGTLTYTSNAAWQSTTPTGAVNNISSNGVESGLSLKVNGHISVSDGIKDTNGNPSLDLGSIPNAVNRIYIDNQSTGNYPTIGTTGPDTNIGLALAPKNDGPVNLFGNAPTIAAAGAANGGNLNLNLKSQGTGIVQANGIPVSTSKMKYPFYSDPARFEPWPQMLNFGGNWSLASGDVPLTLFIPAVNMTVSNIITMSWNDTTQTGATICKVAIYRVDDVFSGGNKMECIARSGHKADRWNGAVVDTAPIVDNGAASPSAISSVNLIAGQEYAIGFISVGHTGTPKLSALGTFRKNTMLPHIGFFGDGGHTDMPVYINSGWLEEWTYVWFALS